MTTQFDGLATVDAYGADITPEDQADIQAAKRILEEIKEVREFDEEARKRYARDRAYARGDSPFSVKVNLIKSYIAILTSFIYARNPDIDVLPAENVGEEGMEDATQIAKGQEVIAAKLWRRARIKAHAKRWVRSVLTIGIGWLKVSWADGKGLSPATKAEIRSLQKNLSMIKAQREKVMDGDTADLEAEHARLKDLIKGATEQIEQLTAQGLIIELVPAEDMTVSDDVPSVLEYHDARWMSHRFFRTPDEAAALFPDVPKDKWKNLCSYGKRKVSVVTDANSIAVPNSEVNATDADQYITGSASNVGKGKFVCFHEKWDSETNLVYTVAEGYDGYCRQPFAAPVSERFYPFFGLSFTEIDGERHPISLVTDSMRLQDEYQRMRSNKKTWRQRTKPKTIFNEMEIGKTDADKLNRGETQEMVGVNPTSGMKADLRKLVVPITYATFDPMLFDTAEVRSELEMLWGIQEALSSSIQVAKTATEAEIQQTGTNARTGAMRDAMEEVLTEMAQYSIELAVQNLSLAEAQEMAGKEVLWTQTDDPSLLQLMVNVEIRAGSSGKPNTTQQREAWASTEPLIEGLIQQIATLRQSDPIQTAQCLEELAIETFDRMGERFDPNRFFPQPAQPEPMMAQDGTMVLAYRAPQAQQPVGAPVPGGGPQLPPGQDPATAPAQLPEMLNEGQPA
jgi:hypothetical protein